MDSRARSEWTEHSQILLFDDLRCARALFQHAKAGVLPGRKDHDISGINAHRNVSVCRSGNNSGFADQLTIANSRSKDELVAQKSIRRERCLKDVRFAGISIR